MGSPQKINRKDSRPIYFVACEKDIAGQRAIWHLGKTTKWPDIFKTGKPVTC